jgi:hypothetical protein
METGVAVVQPTTSYAGTGTTIIAVIALILVIILIIVVVVFYFFPSEATRLEVRGVNFDIIRGSQTGATGSNTDTMTTGNNNLYMSAQLTSDLTLSVNSASTNFIGMTIGIKNNTSGTGGNIIVANGSGVTMSAGGITDGLTLAPGEFAWFVLDSIGNTQNFVRLD